MWARQEGRKMEVDSYDAFFLCREGGGGGGEGDGVAGKEG